MIMVAYWCWGAVKKGVASLPSEVCGWMKYGQGPAGDISRHCFEFLSTLWHSLLGDRTSCKNLLPLTPIVLFWGTRPNLQKLCDSVNFMPVNKNWKY